MEVSSKNTIPSAGPVLQPPGNGHNPGETGNEANRWLWISLALVLLLGLGVILVLPGLIDSSQQQKEISTAVAEVGVIPATATDANKVLQDWLQLRARLELENIAQWGEPGWSQALEMAEVGKRLLVQRNFSAAVQNLGRAVQQLQQLDNSRGTLLAEALAGGFEALAGDDVATAVMQFERVLAIEPDHQGAQAALSRAVVRADVLQQMAIGAEAETNGDLVAAQAAYRQSVLLDAAYEPAISALQQVTGQLQMLAFQDAMTRALGALDAGQLQTAGKALDEAARLQPDNRVVADNRQRLQQMRTAAALASLRRKAAIQAGRENWQAVVDLYRKALKVDNSAGFARSGLTHAGERVKLNAQFDHYLQQPDRIYSPDPLKNAEKLLSAAGRAPVEEPKLAAKISALQQLVQQAATPVAITLHSDGQTEIAIYHVGRLGSFTEHRLELLPGEYTVVGTRTGYRDVRKQLPVLPGNASVSLSIRCEEPV
jgi:tetratricopeptide (TPR) repeat protein